MKRWWQSEPAVSVLIGAIFFLFFFHSRWALQPHWISDEGFYLTRMYHYLGVDWGGVQESDNFYAPGLSLLWLPIGGVVHFICSLLKTDSRDWVWGALSLFSFALWIGSLEVLRLICAKRWQALVLLLAVPVTYYSMHRTLMSHSAEFFVGILTIYYLMARRFVPAALLAGLLTLIRYNDAPVFLVFLGACLDASGNDLKHLPELFSKRLRLPIAALIFFIVLVIGWICFVSGYHDYTLPMLLQNFSLQEVERFLFELSWGIFWIMPAWLWVFGAGLYFFRRLDWMARGSLAWMALEMLLCICWGGNGNDFGQRYLIGACAGAIYLGLQLYPLCRRPLMYLVILQATILSVYYLVYKVSGVVQYVNDPHLIVHVSQLLTTSQYYQWILAMSPPGILWINYLTPETEKFKILILSQNMLTLEAIAVSVALLYCLAFGIFKRRL